MSTSLIIAENLLNEFYHPATQNQRKREIESELISFKNQPTSWQQYLCVLTNFSSNQFLWFYGTSTLEHAITRRWNHLTLSDRTLLRETLWTTYASLPSNVPRRQRDTIAQLIALMGKREFPDDHPNYITHCIELSKVNFQLGMVLLRTTSEEVVSNREDLPSERKKYFHSCISICMPEVVDLLAKYLVISVCHLNGTDLCSIPSNLSDFTLHPSLPNDNRLSTSIVELLECIQHLVSWITVDNLLSEYFLMSIFDLAQWRKEQSEISFAALSVLNELLYLQKAIPHLNTMMTGVNVLLHRNNAEQKHNEMYQDKFRELLRLYTAKYWTKLINNDEIFEQFLRDLYYCTIVKNGALAFVEKLDIWTPLIKGIKFNSDDTWRYSGILQKLVTEIMRKTRYEFNSAELELLDNEIVDDNMQTEWQQFLTQCIETIALIVDAIPIASFEVFIHFSTPYYAVMSIEKDLENSDIFSNKFKCHELHENFRDLSSVCQTLVRIAPLVGTGSRITPTSIFPNMLTVIKLFNSKKFQSLNIDNSMLKSDFIDLYGQLLLAMKTLLAYSADLKTDQILKQIIESVGHILLPTNTYYNDALVLYTTASEFLLFIASEIRPKIMLEAQSIIQLVQGGKGLSNLPKPVVPIVYKIIISCFVFPWRNVSDQQQDYDRRCLILQEYIACLSQDLMALDQNAFVAGNGQESKICTILLSILPPFKEVIGFFNQSNNMIKEMLVDAFKPIINKSLQIYNAYGSECNEIEATISDFTLSSLRTFQTQLGAAFVKEVLNLFVNVTSRTQITVRRLESMERILQMFDMIVQQPGNLSLSLIPSILDVTLEHILPLFQYDKNMLDYSDVAFLMYTLFDSILNFRWQYFYKSQVQCNGANAINNDDASSPQHPEQFLAILNAYGQALVTGNDPNITRTVLISLHNLNERWKLFHRALFKTNLLSSFQCALINALLSAEGALHFDLLISTLYSMGQVDKMKLHDCLMSAGFTGQSEILEDICCSTDIPTFSQKLTQVIQDTRCTRLSQHQQQSQSQLQLQQ